MKQKQQRLFRDSKSADASSFVSAFITGEYSRLSMNRINPNIEEKTRGFGWKVKSGFEVEEKEGVIIEGATAKRVEGTTGTGKYQ